jgi:hypothetical protein
MAAQKDDIDDIGDLMADMDRRTKAFAGIIRTAIKGHAARLTTSAVSSAYVSICDSVESGVSDRVEELILTILMQVVQTINSHSNQPVLETDNEIVQNTGGRLVLRFDLQFTEDAFKEIIHAVREGKSLENLFKGGELVKSAGKRC